MPQINKHITPNKVLIVFLLCAVALKYFSSHSEIINNLISEKYRSRFSRFSLINSLAVTERKLNCAVEVFDPHDHFPAINTVSLSSESISNFEIIRISAAPDLQQVENISTSPGGVFKAFSTCDQKYCRLFVRDLDSEELYELRGLPLSWRPFSNLSWQQDCFLIFDRWSQPNYGIHYVVNLADSKLIFASPISN